MLEHSDFIADLLGCWSMSLNFHSIFFRICLALLMGALIGCERASKRHAAGLRTFILVTLAGTTAMLIDSYLLNCKHISFAAVSAAAIIAAALISGNTVLFSSRSQIKGLTTSAGLWTCVVLGLAIGAGLYTLTIILFIALHFCLSVLPPIEKYLKNRSNHFEIQLELKKTGNLQDFVATIRRLGIRIDDIESNPAFANSGLSVYSVSLTICNNELKKYKRHDEIIEALRSLDYIYHIEEMN